MHVYTYGNVMSIIGMISRSLNPYVNLIVVSYKACIIGYIRHYAFKNKSVDRHGIMLHKAYILFE